MIITLLSIGIAVLGLVLFVLLTGRIREAGEMVKLKRHRSTTAGVADLLNPSAVVEDGIIACKSGALMAAWIYEGDDLASSTDTDRNHVAAVINAALGGLGDGWMIHVDAVRRESPAYIAPGVSHFPDPVSAAIDEERRRFFESQGTMYEGYFVLTATWYPPLLAQTKFTELMFDDDTERPTLEAHYSRLLEQFKKSLQTLESRLSSVFRMERLGAQRCICEDGTEATFDYFLSHLQFCVTGIRQPIRLPSTPVHLDALLGGQELYGGVIPKIGRHFIQVVSIEGFPQDSCPGMLSVLTDLDMEYRWSTRCIFLDRHTANAHIKTYEKKWSQKQHGLVDVVFRRQKEPNEDALNMTKDSEAATSEIESGVVGGGYYTSAVILMNEDRSRLEAAALKLQKTIFNLGFAARIETLNTLDAWMGSIPGHGVENVRRPILNTLNLAHLLPVSSIWTGENAAPCPYYPANAPALMYTVTTGHSPFRLNLHVRDLGHTIMFGPTGAGKSTALATLIVQFLRYEGMTVYAFDKGMSLYVLTRACGGRHYMISGDRDPLRFAPLQYLQSSGDRTWAAEWLESVLELNGVTATPAQHNEIVRTLINMAGSGGKSLTEFVALVQDAEIREALKGYTVDGGMDLLDAEEDGLSLEQSLHLVTFEFSELMERGQKWALPVMLYLFRRIEKSLKGQPAMIVLDEAWSMLEHPVFSARLRMWLKEMRKLNCLVLMATQALEDLANTTAALTETIVQSTATKICLANRNARTAPALYQRLGFNEQQIAIISSCTPKSDYYLMSDKGSRLFSLALQPLALSLVAAGDRDTVLHVQELEKVWGELWLEKYLAEKGLDLKDFQTPETREGAI